MCFSERILPATKEGSMLQFTDGPELYLHDHLYANMPDIKANIERQVSLKKKGL